MENHYEGEMGCIYFKINDVQYYIQGKLASLNALLTTQHITFLDVVSLDVMYIVQIFRLKFMSSSLSILE
jgi:hypothetical protein